MSAGVTLDRLRAAANAAAAEWSRCVVAAEQAQTAYRVAHERVLEHQRVEQERQRPLSAHEQQVHAVFGDHK